MMNSEELIQNLAAWVWRTSLEGSIFLLLIGSLLALGQRFISPQLRVMLWVSVGLRFLLPAVPESSFSLFHAIPTASLVSSDTMSPGVVRGEAVPSSEKTVSESTPRQTRRLPSWTAILPITWMAGVLFLLGFAFIRQFRMRREVRGYLRVTDLSLLAMAQESGICDSVRIVEHRTGGGIGVFGFLCPTHLLVPVDLRERFSEAQIHGILRHEAEHIRRGDLQWNWIVFLVQTLHWFNPLVWFAIRQWQNEREILCDDAALKRESSEARRHYGAALVRAIEGNRFPAAQLAFLPFISRRNEMKQRLHQIMKNPTYSLIPQVSIALVALAAALVTFTSAVTPAGAAEEKGAPPAEEGKNANPEKKRDGDKPKEGPKDKGDKGARENGDKGPAKEGEGDKGPAKEGERPAANPKMNTKEGKVFQAYDKDGDGAVTAKEIEAMLEGKQNSAGRREIRKAVDRSDADADEKLNLDEFVFWYTKGRLDTSAENR
jgi:beta-lactamase regulating signal transducer with metallopeptidase domain